MLAGVADAVMRAARQKGGRDQQSDEGSSLSH
jgi:hypothetical protein